MRGNHDGTNLRSRSANRAGPLQSLGRESRCSVRIVDATKLVSRVVVAMNRERDARCALSQKPSRGPVDVPLVQGYRRSRHAVVVGFGMSGELAVVEIAVGPPMQVRVVEDEARL